VLAVLRVGRVANVVQGLDQAGRVALGESDAKLDDIGGVCRGGVCETCGGSVAALVDVPTATDAPTAASASRQRQRREEKREHQRVDVEHDERCEGDVLRAE
jgi:hypothetical protein